MNTNLLMIENNEQEIRATNYFESEYAQRGAFYLTINAGAFRLLVPPAHESIVAEFRTAREVIISRGAWPAARRKDAIEILFDDHTDNPFSLHFGAEQIDRFPIASDALGEWIFSAWVRGKEKPACVYRSKCHYQVVPKLPHLKPLESDGR